MKAKQRFYSWGQNVASTKQSWRWCFVWYGLDVVGKNLQQAFTQGYLDQGGKIL